MTLSVRSHPLLVFYPSNITQVWIILTLRFFVWFHWRKADFLTLTSEISFLSLLTLVRSSLVVLSWFSCCLLSCEWICSSSRLHADSEASVVRSRVSKSCMVDSLSDTVCVRRVNSDCTCACSDYNRETWSVSDKYYNIAPAKEHFLGWTEERLKYAGHLCTGLAACHYASGKDNQTSASLWALKLTNKFTTSKWVDIKVCNLMF